MVRRRPDLTAVPSAAVSPPASQPLFADPRTKNGSLLIAAVVVYAVCLLALAILGIWG